MNELARRPSRRAAGWPHASRWAAGLRGDAGRLLQVAQVAERSYPTDYRERHPITLRERAQTVEVFVSRNRGGLTPMQRADVLSFAQQWRAVRP